GKRTRCCRSPSARAPSPRRARYPEAPPARTRAGRSRCRPRARRAHRRVRAGRRHGPVRRPSEHPHEVLDRGHGVSRRQHRDGVDADASALGRVRRAPLDGQAPEPGELHGRDRLEGVPERGRGARLHLDEDEGVTVAHDEVDLALPTPPVALHESIPASQQVLLREPLAAPAQVVFRRHANEPDGVADAVECESPKTREASKARAWGGAVEPVPDCGGAPPYWPVKLLDAFINGIYLNHLTSENRLTYTFGPFS